MANIIDGVTFVNNIREYVRLKTILNNMSGKIENGKYLYFHEGRYKTEDEIKHLFEFNNVKINKCGTGDAHLCNAQKLFNR